MARHQLPGTKSRDLAELSFKRVIANEVDELAPGWGEGLPPIDTCLAVRVLRLTHPGSISLLPTVGDEHVEVSENSYSVEAGAASLVRLRFSCPAGRCCCAWARFVRPAPAAHPIGSTARRVVQISDQ